jgi:hypothetical protein
VSRTSVTPYAQLVELLQLAREGRSPVRATCAILVSDVEAVCADKLAVTVLEDPIEGNPAHAEIVAKSLDTGAVRELTRGMSNDLLRRSEARNGIRIL